MDIAQKKQLQYELQKQMLDKKQIEREMDASKPQLEGALNFGYFKMKRRYEEIQTKIRYLHSMIDPDIIA